MNDIVGSAGIALVDLDNTVADYQGEMTRRMSALAAPGEESYDDVYGTGVPKHIRARRALIRNTPGFWRELPPIENGFIIVGILREFGYALHVLTKGPDAKKHPNAWTEKAEWCAKHLPDAAITIGQDKSLVYGRVLVDDFPEYYLPWLDHRPRGLVISVAQSWNESERHPRAFRFDGTPDSARELREALCMHAGRMSGG